jgi:hypothetical protein
MTLFIVVATRETDDVSAGLVVVLPFVTLALSVLVAAVSSKKHAILAKETSSVANRMLVDMMLLNVVCGDDAAK